MPKLKIKKCIKCNNELLLEMFPKHKNTKDGHLNYCKECRKKQIKENVKNRIDIQEYYKNYREKNSEIIKQKYKIYYEKNKIQIKKKNKIRNDNNKEKIKEINKQRYLDNPEKQKKYNKNWARKNKKIKNKNARKNYRENIEKNAWRNLLKNSLIRLGQSKEASTIELLGYSAIDLKNYIESKFTEGMNWENYGEWHIDHIKPIRLFDKNADVAIVNSLNNLQPLWATSREINGIFYEGNLNKG